MPAAPAAPAAPSGPTGAGAAGHEQLGFEGMPERLYAATPTRLTTWLDCPRRYRLTYLDRPAPVRAGAWAHTSVGTAVHQAMADWWALPVRARTPAAAARLVRSRWRPEGFRDAAQSGRWAEKVADETAAYAATQDPSSRPVGVELTVSARTPVLALSGRVDRLDDRDGELVVVDYKTSRRALGADEAAGSLAMGLYAVCVAAVLRRPCTAVELHHVPTGAVVRHDHDEASLQQHVSTAERVGARLASADAAHEHGTSAEEFTPRPGPRCGWCDVRQHCPEGRRATPQRLPWSALEP
ncbi:MAG TPA: PD-(D/E)XK nuclease family protein [Actinomycetales bacterium]